MNRQIVCAKNTSIAATATAQTTIASQTTPLSRTCAGKPVSCRRTSAARRPGYRPIPAKNGGSVLKSLKVMVAETTCGGRLLGRHSLRTTATTTTSV